MGLSTVNAHNRMRKAQVLVGVLAHQCCGMPCGEVVLFQHYVAGTMSQERCLCMKGAMLQGLCCRNDVPRNTS